MNKIFLWLVIGVIMVAPIGATGKPDYGKSLASNPTVQSYDAGEDTTRLLMGGGANSRSGRWLWATGFESGLDELTFAGNIGGGSTPAIESTYCYMGKACVLSTQPAVVGATGYINKRIFSPFNSSPQNIRIGCEFMVGNRTVTKNQISWFIDYSDPDNPAQHVNYEVRLIAEPVNVGNLYVVDSAGLEVLIGNVNQQMFDFTPYYHYGKLVIDVQTKNYVRFTFDNAIYDLSSYSGQIAAGRGLGINCNIYHKNIDGLASVTARFDNFIITGDEP